MIRFDGWMDDDVLPPRRSFIWCSEINKSCTVVVVLGVTALLVGEKLKYNSTTKIIINSF
jgi:hypothetical protein